jgi:arsenate reductase-like glutaredoxin family protein
LDVITIFHKPSIASSQRALALLKRVSAEASETATVDQASDHAAQNKIQRDDFELNVSEEPPTGDQLRSILEYIGPNRAKDLVKGSNSVSEAIRLLHEDKNRFQPPVVG